jgi:hypothetical protein
LFSGGHPAAFELRAQHQAEANIVVTVIRPIVVAVRTAAVAIIVKVAAATQYPVTGLYGFTFLLPKVPFFLMP